MFYSCGELAKAMGGFVYKLGPYLNQLIEVVKEGMTVNRMCSSSSSSCSDLSIFHTLIWTKFPSAIHV